VEDDALDERGRAGRAVDGISEGPDDRAHAADGPVSERPATVNDGHALGVGRRGGLPACASRRR
jgi:hypothetical protein